VRGVGQDSNDFLLRVADRAATVARGERLVLGRGEEQRADPVAGELFADRQGLGHLAGEGGGHILAAVEVDIADTGKCPAGLGRLSGEADWSGDELRDLEQGEVDALIVPTVEQRGVQPVDPQAGAVLTEVADDVAAGDDDGAIRIEAGAEPGAAVAHAGDRAGDEDRRAAGCRRRGLSCWRH
jgi:hypothetical protein